MSHYESRQVKGSQKESGRFRTGHYRIGMRARDEEAKEKDRGGRVVTLPPCQGPKTIR